MSIRTFVRPLVLAAALAFAGGHAVAAPTVNTLGGDTRVALSSTFLEALRSLGVSASSTYPASIRSGVARFPIPTGEIDAGTYKGEIVHQGGLDLSAGAVTVNISSFVIDTTGATPVLTGLVKANDSLVGRIALFDLALGTAPRVQSYGRYGSLRIDDVAVTLDAEAAAALNDVFGVTAFTAGIPIGTARVNTYFYEPDRTH
ncbi:MAG: hypothetical protein ACTHOH_10115 [Lysobacteraceae bacterium]